MLAYDDQRLIWRRFLGDSLSAPRFHDAVTLRMKDGEVEAVPMVRM